MLGLPHGQPALARGDDQALAGSCWVSVGLHFKTDSFTVVKPDRRCVSNRRMHKITNFIMRPLRRTWPYSLCYQQLLNSMVDMENHAAAQDTARTRSTDKDAPLKEDIRLLGRLLGDVLRDQEGDDVFDVVETIRQTAVRFRRDADAAGRRRTDHPAAQARRATRPFRWCARFPISRTWPISPKTSTTSAAAARTCWPAPRRSRAASRYALTS